MINLNIANNNTHKDQNKNMHGQIGKHENESSIENILTKTDQKLHNMNHITVFLLNVNRAPQTEVKEGRQTQRNHQLELSIKLWHFHNVPKQ